MMKITNEKALRASLDPREWVSVESEIVRRLQTVEAPNQTIGNALLADEECPAGEDINLAGD